VGWHNVGGIAFNPLPTEKGFVKGGKRVGTSGGIRMCKGESKGAMEEIPTKKVVAG